MRTNRLTPADARQILGVTRLADFHALTSEQVEALLIEANKFAYRRPKQANGSRARYFHAYLRRLAARKD